METRRVLVSCLLWLNRLAPSLSFTTCTIPQLRQYMLDNKLVTEAEIKAIDARVAEEIEDSVKFADESPKPDRGQLLENVFADPRGFGIGEDGRCVFTWMGWTTLWLIGHASLRRTASAWFGVLRNTLISGGEAVSKSPCKDQAWPSTAHTGQKDAHSQAAIEYLGLGSQVPISIRSRKSQDLVLDLSSDFDQHVPKRFIMPCSAYPAGTALSSLASALVPPSCPKQGWAVLAVQPLSAQLLMLRCCGCTICADLGQM